MLPPPPDGTVKFELEVLVADKISTFGFWLLIPGAAAIGVSYASELITSWVLGPQTDFLGAMHSAAKFYACRLSFYGVDFFRYREELADNTGALTAGQDPCLSVSLYLQTLGAGRGSGSRIHLSGIGNEMTTDFYYLSSFGLNTLQNAASALKGWVNGPFWPAGPIGQLGTVRRRTDDGPLLASSWDPATDVTPSRNLTVLARRQYVARGISS